MYYQLPIFQGQFYTLLFCVKRCDNVLLLNFDSEDIKVNESAVEKMVRMREESLFSLQQTLIELNGICMCLLHVRPWNVHLEYFLSDKIYSAYSSLLCLTETNINESPA